MGKNKTPTSVAFSSHIAESYKRWVHIFTQGCTDPSYKDGVNIDLVRNHILYYKKKCEEVLKGNFFAYPEEYFYPDPMQLPQDFMAVPRVAPILGNHLGLAENVPVPAKTYGLTLSKCLKFDWGEVLKPFSISEAIEHLSLVNNVARI